MADAANFRQRNRLSPDVTRVLYVRNLPFKLSSEELYDIFGKYGPIRQIRVGAANENRGKAFVIYEDIYDAKDALEHLNGFNVCGRYLVVLYFHPEKEQKRMNLEKQRKEVEELRKMVDAGRKGT
ncbi:14 kda subunit splicing factor 3b [Nannochloropsis gaditana]|uniref:14 kDa subunit splicing factor 3b n=1 Tax=Nannochloropsis gaditana TaxID=72520 RepID=W7TF67_9STRA|nr:14 kda subunit splicing factor 3b [Nannochloropsis gaditana]